MRSWLIFTVVSAVGGLWLAHTMMSPRSGIRVSRDEASMSRLPANASNITFYIRAPASYYEFDTDQAGFEEWAGMWSLPWERSDGQKWVVVWDHAKMKIGEVEVEDGVRYSWAKQDAGWSLTFDRRTRRAYCSGHYR
jgi:hypothetical protein